MWHLVPISGFGFGWDAWRFVVLPVAIGVLAGVGGPRACTALSFWRRRRDYVRTARQGTVGGSRIVPPRIAQRPHPCAHHRGGSPDALHRQPRIRILLRHSGAGGYTIEAIRAQDFLVVRAMVFLGAVLYIVGLILTDFSYTLADPRVRLQ
jgi:peptide/nickel transport system permease protein